MKRWLKRIRGAVGMGLTWAIGWALVGILIGVSSILLPGLPWWDAFFEVFDAPLPALAVPGFFGGAIFSIVLGIAARRRRFAELSLPLFAVCGALGGLLLSQVPNAMVALGLATPAQGVNIWRLTAIVSGPFALLGAVSACATLLLARKVEDRAGLEDAVSELPEGEPQRRLAESLGAPDVPIQRSQRAQRDPVIRGRDGAG